MEGCWTGGGSAALPLCREGLDIRQGMRTFAVCTTLKGFGYMGKGIIVSGRTGVICVMLWAAVLPMKPLCAAEDNAGSGICVELYEDVVPDDGIVTEGYCGPTGREKSVRWRIEGDTLRYGAMGN